VEEGAFSRVCAALDPGFIEEALVATGTATLRRRRLPADQVLWLILGMALMRDRPIVEVASRLGLALPGKRGPTASPAAVSQARTRLGPKPLKWLFEHCSKHWALDSARRHAWRGLALFAGDGTTQRVPDSPANRAHFGGQACGPGVQSGYPLIRLFTLTAARSHLLYAMGFGPYDSEHVYAKPLWQALPDHSLTLLDRGFFGANILIPLQRAGTERHWMTRAKKNLRWTVVRKLGRGDALVELVISPQAREADPSLPERWLVRAIEYQRRGFAPQVVLTSLLDAVKYPAKEVVERYHERWEIELGYDEIKTEMLDREESLRSLSPEAVEQEVWGIGLTYNLVRLEMERAAEELGVKPNRISFVMALRWIEDEWVWCANASPGSIPKNLARLRENLKRLVLPPRRSQRHYPRAVKITLSKYPRKKLK
jgi:hypothetical protein